MAIGQAWQSLLASEPIGPTAAKIHLLLVVCCRPAASHLQEVVKSFLSSLMYHIDNNNSAKLIFIAIVFVDSVFASHLFLLTYQITLLVPFA